MNLRITRSTSFSAINTAFRNVAGSRGNMPMSLDNALAKANQHRSRLQRALTATLAATLWFAPAAPVFAQSGDTSAAASAPVTEPSTRTNRLLEEVVVTARRRTENTQDVPIAIVAFSEEKLDAIGIETAQQLDKITPGLVFGSVIGFNTVFLRGIGSDAYLPSADPSVPIYVDDINSLPSQGSIDALVNVERIEVLKGPQGTLFGRNALGGAIRIVTPNPSDEEVSGKVKFDVGRYRSLGADTASGSFFLNLPLREGMAMTLSGIHRDNESLYTNELGERVFGDVLKGGRMKWAWYATPELDITLSVAYDEAKTAGGLAAEGTQPSAVACANCEADPEFDYRTQHNVPAALESRRVVGSAYVNWELPWFSSKMILSDQTLNVPYGFGDLDYTSSPLLVGNVGVQFAKQQTAEIRIESNQNTPLSDRLTWTGGFYYLKSAGGYDPLFLRFGSGAFDGVPTAPVLQDALSAIGAPLATSDLVLASYGILETDSISAFFEGSYAFNDVWELSVGLRYDEESRIVDGSRVDIVQDTETMEGTNFSSFDVPEATTSRTSPRVSLKWNFDQGQVYASYSVGYLSPTYNTVNFFEAPDFVEQEKDTAYELGFKGSWLSGRLQMEGAVFRTVRENIITAYTALTSGGAVNFFNAEEGEIFGAELSLQAQPMPNLNPGLAVILAGSYLDTEYTDFTEGRGFDEETGLAFGPGSANGEPARDFTGNEIVSAPDNTISATVIQNIPIGGLGDLEVAVDTYYNAGYYFTAQNTFLVEQEAYQTWDARITWFCDPWGFQLTAYGENLTNERYFASAVHLDFGPGRSLAAPTQFGVRGKWSF